MSWPRQPNKTYIVQYAPALGSTWTNLAVSFPASTVSNRTTYVHTNIVRYPAGSGGGSSGGGPAPQPSAAMTSPEAPKTKKEKKNDDILPPWPGDPGTWAPTSENPFASVTAQNSTLEVIGATGFYRVVANGVHFVGIAPGSSISGAVNFGVEIGHNLELPLAGFDITLTNGSPVQGLTYSLEDFTARWETAFVTNGTYKLRITAFFGEDGVHKEFSEVLTVSVFNQISFPEPYNVAGFLIDIQARSIHTNGNYNLKLYDDTGFLVYETSGLLDSAGFLGDEFGPGLVLENFDPATGEQYASAYYNAVITTTPAGLTQQASNSNTTTNKIWIEPPWPSGFYTQFAIGYQPIYGSTLLGNPSAVALQSMVQLVYTFAAARPGGLAAIRGDDQNPFEMKGQGPFNTLLADDLREDRVRNLYYFGHGAPSYIGHKEPAPRLPDPGYITASQISKTLKNNFDPMKGFTNGHPFRFVFLDGCETANGSLCKAFGIPREENMAFQRFNQKGLRQRSFIGWKGWVAAGVANSVNNQHLNFMTYFWEGWQNPDGNNEQRTLREAIRYAMTQRNQNPSGYSFQDELVLYGSGDLLWEDTLP
ncbi:MAG: hypothetical protein SFY81_12690 [Verrucomicrobiota bacterium]|nr:hypothetical protein [Verrucomicrobiota bacterium]